MHTVSSAYQALQPDQWRLQEGFSPDIQQVQEGMFQSSSADEIAKLLNGWIIKSPNQPCLFGRHAGANQQIGYCILREEDLLKKDDEVAGLIQRAREAFQRKAYRGEQSAFIILAASRRLAEAKPSYDLASAITRLYLELEEVEPDTIYLEQVSLEIPGRKEHALQWNAGVNFFAAHGDRRWWHDHRIPGGIALSVNSVGHLVRSHQAKQHDDLAAATFGIVPDEQKLMGMKGFPGALTIAMQTVENTPACPYGKATRLYSRAEKPVQEGISVPELTGKLKEMNPCKYAGWYHTDYTLPEVFFREDVTRAADVEEEELDFTYLFHRSPDNPDFNLMGEGRQIRATGDTSDDAVSPRDHKMVPVEVEISDNPLLYRALYLSED